MIELANHAVSHVLCCHPEKETEQLYQVGHVTWTINPQNDYLTAFQAFTLSAACPGLTATDVDNAAVWLIKCMPQTITDRIANT